MAGRRPQALLGPAFSLANIESADGSMHLEPVCAARCEPMSRIDDHLFIGSWRDIESPENLRAQGVTHILNVAKEVDPTVRESTLEQFTSMHIPLVDEHRENILDYMEAACSFIESARAAGGKCLVHCRRGISRSPAIVVGYLMRHECHVYEHAVEIVKERRKCVSLNIAFRDFLSTYETPHMKTARTASSQFAEGEEDHAGPTPGHSEGEGGDAATTAANSATALDTQSHVSPA